MATEDRHDEDLFPPDPSREDDSPSPEEEEEEFFVLEEEEGSEGEEEIAGADEAGPGAPHPVLAREEDDAPSKGEPPEKEIDESLFAEPDEFPDPGLEGEQTLEEPLPGPGEPEVFVQEPPGSEEEALSLEGEESGEEGKEGASGPVPEDVLFEDMEGGGEAGFGVDLPKFSEGGGGEEDLLDALEEFDPEEVHDAPRGGDASLDDLGDLGLDLDLETDLELVDEVADLVGPSERGKESQGDDDALELVLEEDGAGSEMRVDPGGGGQDELVPESEDGAPAGGPVDLDLGEGGEIDESLFEEVEPPAGSFAPEPESPEDLPAVDEGLFEEDGAPGTDSGEVLEFQDGDMVEEETPANPLLSSPEDAGSEAAGEDGEGGPSGVAPWMVPEDVLEETPEGLAAAPSEETLLGGEEGGEELPEIGLRPLEEEAGAFTEEGEEEPEGTVETSPEGEPSFEDLYGVPGPTGSASENMGEVETSDSLMVEAPRVVGSIYQEEKHGWGVKLILWGSLAASLAVAAFVGWVYMNQKSALSRRGETWTARVEMPKPVLSDQVPPPELRPRERVAWKAFQGPLEPPPPGTPKAAGPGKKPGPFPTEPVAPPAGKTGPGKLAGGPGAGKGSGTAGPTAKPVEPLPAQPPVEKPAKPSEPVAKSNPPGGGRIPPVEPGKKPAQPVAPVEPPGGLLAKAGPGGEVPVPAVPSEPSRPSEPGAGKKTSASPPPSSGLSPQARGWKDAMGLVRGTQVLAELTNGNYFVGRIYKIGGRKVILDVKKGQLTFYYDEVAHLMPIGPALARKLKEHPSGFVILKNTNRLKGEIVVEAKDYVTIQVREARITIPRESIERVEKGKETSLKLTEDPVLARELGMEDIPAEEEKPKAKPAPAPAFRAEQSVPTGAVEELDRLLGASRREGSKEEGQGKSLTLPGPGGGKVKVKGGL